MPDRLLPTAPPPAPAAAAAAGVQHDGPQLPASADAPQMRPSQGAVHLPSLTEVLQLAVREGASDVHLVVGAPPALRVNGAIHSLLQYTVLDDQGVRSILEPLQSSGEMRGELGTGDLDMSWVDPGAGRFRVNISTNRGAVNATFRHIPSIIPDLPSLGLPEVVESLCDEMRGLILVTGITGSGKSTTLASMIQRINGNRFGKIVTIEDPIEFIHPHSNCLVVQRELGVDTPTFPDAMRFALRQDPDIILVGEMRDPETISTAVSAAETGHLVLSTVHTRSAADSVSRIIEAFPASQQPQIRTQLASSLVAVLSQSLLPLSDGGGRAAAVEVMVATPAIRTMIRESKLEQIPSAIQAGGKLGMQTLNQALAKLVKSDKVERRIAEDYSPDAEDLGTLLTRR